LTLNPKPYFRGDKTKFAGREDQVTGGWTGGEMALKLKARASGLGRA